MIPKKIIGVLFLALAMVFSGLAMAGAEKITQGLPEPPVIADGATYYLQGGDIYRFSLETGLSERLTYFQTPGDISALSVAPERGKILFTRESGGESFLHSVNIDGSGEENLSDRYNLGLLTRNQRQGVFSPDGLYLAFSAQPVDGVYSDTYQVYLKELTGPGRLYQLTSGEWECSYPLFLDESMMLFRSERKTDETSYALYDYHLIGVYGYPLINITNNSDTSPFFARLGRPMVSPAGDMLIYARQDNDNDIFSNWGIYYRDLDSFGTEIEIFTEELYYSEADPALQADPMPVFTGEDAFVFRGESPYTSDQKLFYSQVGQTNPYLVELQDTQDAVYPDFASPLPFLERMVYVAGNEQIYVWTPYGEKQVTSDASLKFDPVFDSSGNYIAFAANGISVMNALGEGRVKIETNIGARYPTFSPCNGWVAYIIRDKDKGDDIYYAPSDASVPPVRLTFNPLQKKFDLAFSPCGSRLLYTGEDTGFSGRQIWSLPVSVSVSGIALVGAPGNITYMHGVEHYHPGWSPDGRDIIFSTSLNGGSIYTMTRTGAYRQKVAFFGGDPHGPVYPVFAPYGGTKIAYMSGGTVETAYLDIASGEAFASDAPGISTLKKFSWGRFDTRAFSARRAFITAPADPELPFAYQLTLEVNPLDSPGTVILTEQIPDGWIFLEASYAGQALNPQSIQNGLVKWILESSDIGQGGILRIVVDPDSDPSAIRVFNGSVEYGGVYQTTTGHAYLPLGEPYIPADLDMDWIIDDDEILFAIEHWAGLTRIGAWPEDPADWDVWILKLIDFWAHGGYEYSPVGDEPGWSKN